MRFSIEHEIPGRLRINLHGSIPEHDALALPEIVSGFDGVTSCKVYPRTGSVAIAYAPGCSHREALLDALCKLDLSSISQHTVDIAATAPETDAIVASIAGLVIRRAIKRWFVPRPVAIAWSLVNASRFFARAGKSLLAGRIDTPVLDAAAVGVSLVQGDFKTAGTTMFLLTLSDLLEDLTKRRSQEALVSSLLDIPTRAWRVGETADIEVDINDICEGDLIRVRMGSRIPVDGVVVEGGGAVNQATLTGEPLAIHRTVGDNVFAGTVVEEGEVVVRTTIAPRETKLRQIGALVDHSEALKSATEFRMNALADRLVPYNFLLAGIVFAATRDITKLSAALMVDYSCALKFAGSMASLTALRESAQHGFTVKGASCFEEIEKADTIVFDKTGTLTNGEPRVAKVIAFDNWDEDEVLRLSACLEEHFPHPVARAVVNAALEKGLEHRERHAQVEYIVAHGIATSLGGKRVIIGSPHFIFEDEGVELESHRKGGLTRRIGHTSPLFLAVDHKLAGVICIDDPLRPQIAERVAELRELGIERVVMLTGDNEKTARRIAEAAGINEYRANMLPEEKHEYLQRLRDEGRRVIMVGDGVNDSPALSLANVGIAMGDGAAIAREVSDVTLSGNDLSAIARLRRLSCAYSRRMQDSFRAIIGINSALLALGIGGIMAPTLSSLIHNGSTVALSLRNTKPYL